MATKPKYESLGHGAYGIVIYPALPNTNDKGKPVNVSGMVTKLIYRQSDYSKTLRNTNTIKRILPSLYIPTFQYKDWYTYGQLMDMNVIGMPDSVKTPEQISRFRNRIAYLVRMPNLGENCLYISRTSEEYNKFIEVPVKIMIEQVIKLMYVVKDIKDAGYIHGDIRETNVLCNVHDGTMTIIDFDWLDRTDKFIKGYPKYYYAHPPELIKVLQHSEIKKHTIDEWIDKEKHKYDALIIEDGDTKDTIAEKLKEGVAKSGDSNDAYVDKCLHTVDSYGLAIAFARLFKVLSKPEQMPFKDFLFTKLIPQMFHPNLTERILIEDAIDLLKGFADEQHIEISPIRGALKDEVARITAMNSLIKDMPLKDIVKEVRNATKGTPGNTVKALAKATNAATNKGLLSTNGPKNTTRKNINRANGTKSKRSTLKGRLRGFLERILPDGG